MHDACVILCITLFNKLFGLLSKLLAFLIRNNFPKRLSHEPLHYLSKFYDDVQFTFVEPPPPPLEQVYLLYPPPPRKQSLVVWESPCLSVRLSVCPSVCSLCVRGHNSVTTCPLWIIFYTIIVHVRRVCHDLDPKSYLQGHCHSAHIPEIRAISVPCWIKIIFHTSVFHDQRMYNDLDPRSYLQGQGHSTHIPKICVRAIIKIAKLNLDNISHNSRSESYSVLTTISHFSRKRTLKFLMCLFYISIHL